MENGNLSQNNESNSTEHHGNNKLFLLAAVLIIGCSGFWFWKSQQIQKEEAAKVVQMPPVSVRIMESAKSDAPITFEYTGQTTGYMEAEVRAQVSGILVKKDYREGEPIKAGQILFRIDPAPYRATLNRNIGSLKQSQVQMNLAKVEFNRVSALYKKNAVSKTEYDNAEANMQGTAASVDSAKAAVRQSQIDLGWTVVRAPISGLSSKEQFSVGNLINVGDMLTQIVQSNPVYVDFAIPADEYRNLEKMRSQGILMTSKSGLQVKVSLGDGTVYPIMGKIDFQNQFVDPSTASIKARAVFDNKKNDLYPGQFVRVSVIGGYLKDVIRVPLRATLQSSEGTIVYVIDGKNIPTARKVAIVKMMGNDCLVGSGLNVGEKIIIDGVAKVIPGKAVAVVNEKQAKVDSGDISAAASDDKSAKQN